MTAIALVQKLKNLPPVSQAALKLLSLLDRSSVDNDNIVQVLKYDNVLTAKLLRACNAPSFGLGEPVASVDQAVLILGHQQILHIVMMLSFKGAMVDSSLTDSLETDQLWEHSVLSAVAAETVLDQLPDLDAKANVAFTASLLHDIGKLVMARTLSAEEIAEIRDRAERKQISGTDAEREVLGLDHSEVGAALLKSWRLPEDIVEAAANHHRPALKPEVRLSTLVHVSNAIAHHASQQPGQNIHDLKIADDVAAAFGIDDKKVEEMAQAIRESSEQVERFMAMA
jgi:putative nucleotidyltransferase with HDIG domain